MSTDVNDRTPSRRLTREEFASLFERACPTLRVIASAEVGRADAEDVLQEAAMSAMRKLDEFEAGTNFGAWMAAFVRYCASNHRRSERRHKSRRRRLAKMQRPSADHTDPRLVESDERLLEAMEHLSADQRCCILLKVVMSHTYQDIATILEIPVATARSHVFRARQRLFELLPEEGVTHA